MNKHISRARLVRGVLASALLVPLLLSITGCFNVPPIAAFTINSQAGQAPFAVNFSATLSEDEDGVVILFEWDFGDGTSGSGENVTHTYTTAGTYTVVLRITDDDGETARNSKTIYVSRAAPPGPTASFSASPTSGESVLTVFVDATDSSYDAGVISQYKWTWGDGSTGYGKTASHSYFSTGAKTYTLTLTVDATDGKTATATRTISITVAGGTTPAAGAPSARFDLDYATGVAPLQVHFDPSDSEADEGRTIILYTWSFGDGSATSDISATVKEHVFTTDTTSEIFSVTLVVTDNEGASNSITKTVKAYNHRPVAGFEIGNPPDGDNVGGLVQYVESDVPNWDYEGSASGDDHRDEWVPDDVVYGNLGTLQTASVVIRSMANPDTDWFDLTDTGDQDTLELADGTDATSTSTPGEPLDYDDHNYSYDGEGQDWLVDFPDWFTNQSWGLRYLYVNWGDNTGIERVDFDPDEGDDTVAWHVYDCSVDGKVFQITVTAEDYLGYQSGAFSRYVTVKKGVEGGGDL
ncbi:PKD domain-containing protein [Candidatus Bipolaricaulota bacterium]